MQRQSGERTQRILRCLLAGAVVLGLLPSLASATPREPQPDDAFPGVPLAPSPVTGELGRGDEIDLFSVELAEGDTIEVSLTGRPETQFMVGLFEPAVIDTLLAHGKTRETPVMYVGSDTGTYPEHFEYTVPEGNGGTHYLGVADRDGRGWYELTYTITPAGPPPPPEPQTGQVNVSVRVKKPPRTLTFGIAPLEAPDGGAITESAVDFGLLRPNVPKTATQALTVTTDAPGGYVVTVLEQHPLSSGANALEDVTGDDGSITESSSGPWSSPTTPGFGFTVTGADAAFSGGFRQFADWSSGEDAQAVMGAGGPVSQSTVNLTYRIGVATSQQPGEYASTITYIATGYF